jgi:hypothetical protein
MELHCTPKVNTLQLNTVRNSSNTRTRPTRTVSEHLTPTEFFHQDLLWRSSNTHSHSCSQKASKHTRSIRRRAIVSIAHHNGASAHSPSLACHLPAPTIECLHRPPYRLTCFSHCFPDTTQSSNQKESIARHTSTSVLERSSNHTSLEWIPTHPVLYHTGYFHSNISVSLLSGHGCCHCYVEAFVFIVALTREYNNDAPFNCCVTGESWCHNNKY